MANRRQLDNERPDGRPIEGFVRIDPTDGGGGNNDDLDISKDFKTLTLIINSEEKKSKVKQVLASDSTTRQLYDQSIRIKVKDVAMGQNLSVLLVGSSKTSKRQTFEEIVPLFIEALANEMINISNQAKNEGAKLSFLCGATYVEIIDEVVHDLLKTDNLNLLVDESPVRGYEPDGCSYKGPYNDLRQLKNDFARGNGNRETGQMDFGLASVFSTAVFSMDVTSFVRMPNGNSDVYKSKVIFAEMPGTESLANDAATLAQRQGANLNKSLKQFQNVSRALANPKSDEADFARFACNSKATHLLAEALGGNSNTCILGFCRQGNSKGSEQTLNLLNLLQRATTYPLDQNNNMVQGYTRLLRIRIKEKDSQVHMAAMGKGFGVDDKEKNIQRLKDDVERLKEKGVKDKLEILKLREDNKLVYQKLQEFRKKYNELVNSKASLQEQLLKSEEEKLRISKALVDLQIENNDLVERSEADKYELVTKLLNAENDILEMEMKEQKKVRSTEDLETKIKSLTKEKKDLAMEFVTLKNNFVNLNKEYKAELAKNEELGVELLTLVNQKNAIEAEKKNLTDERDGLKKANLQLRQEIAEVQSANRETENRLRMEQERTQKLTSEKAKTEMALERNRVDFEKRGVLLEKSVSDLQRERDSELLNIRKGGETEQKRYEEKQMKLTKNLGDLETRLRQTHRKLMESEKNLSKALQDNSALDTAKNALEVRVKSMTDNYRSKLLEYLSENRSEGQGEEQRQSIVNEMTQTFKVNEERMNRQLSEARREGHNLMLQNRAIYSQYKELRNRLEDIDPTNRSQLPPEPSREQFVATLSEREQEYEHQLNQLRERLRQQTIELTSSKEKGVESAETFRKMLKGVEKQNADLNGDNKLLKQQKEHLEKELEIMASSGGGGGGGSDVNTARALKQLKSLQENLMQQMADLRRTGVPTTGHVDGGNVGGGADPVALANAREDARKARAEVKEMELRLMEANRKVNSSQSGGGGAIRASNTGGGGDNTELVTLKAQVEQERLQAEIDSLRKQIVVAQGENVAAGKYSDDPNKRAAELMTRNAVIEEELKNYQAYMKNAQMKFTKTVKKLKTHLSFWKKKAVAAGVSPDLKP